MTFVVDAPLTPINKQTNHFFWYYLDLFHAPSIAYKLA